MPEKKMIIIKISYPCPCPVRRVPLYRSSSIAFKASFPPRPLGPPTQVHNSCDTRYEHQALFSHTLSVESTIGLRAHESPLRLERHMVK